MLRIHHRGIDVAMPKPGGDAAHVFTLPEGGLGKGMPQPVGRRLRELRFAVMEADRFQERRGGARSLLDNVIQAVTRRHRIPFMKIAPCRQTGLGNTARHGGITKRPWGQQERGGV